MRLGDYVWFCINDDVLAGKELDLERTWIPGKIIKYTSSSRPAVYWISRLPVKGNTPTLPLWGIPINKVKPMTNEEIMLAMLES